MGGNTKNQNLNIFPEITPVSKLSLRVFFPSNEKISIEIKDKIKPELITLFLKYCYSLLSLASTDREDFFISLNSENLGQFAFLKVQKALSS